MSIERPQTVRAAAIAFYCGRLGFERVEDQPVPEQGKRWVFVRPPQQHPYGRVAVFQDLYGNLWDLVQPHAGRARPPVSETRSARARRPRGPRPAG